MLESNPEISSFPACPWPLQLARRLQVAASGGAPKQTYVPVGFVPPLHLGLCCYGTRVTGKTDLESLIRDAIVYAMEAQWKQRNVTVIGGTSTREFENLVKLWTTSCVP